MASAFFQPFRFATLLAAASWPCIGVTADSPRESGLPFVQLFHRSDYRGHAQVWCGATDARGLLYFGNYAQVLAYDGVQWDRIAVPGATFVRALSLDARGRLWVGAFGALGYIDTAPDAPPRFVSLVDRLPANARDPGDILRVHVVGDSVYFQSPENLFRWRDEKFDAWPLAGGGPWQSMVLRGEIILQNPQRGWLRLGARGLERADASLTAIAPVRFALPMSGDRWVIGTPLTGLFSYDGHAVTRTMTDATPYLRTNFIFNGTRLADGRYAMATRHGGAVVLSPELSFQAVVDEAAGLPSNSVNHVFADAFGGLWLCLDDGIARVADAFAASWFRPPGPLARLEDFALERFGGRLHLGAGRDLLRLDPPSSIGTAHWEVRDKFDTTVVALLAVDDTLLVATGDGVYASQEGRPRRRLAPLADCVALLAPAASPGRVVVAHRGGIALLQRDGAGWAPPRAIAGTGSPVQSLTESADGVLWATTADNRIVRVEFPAAEAEPRVETFVTHARQLRTARAGGQPLFLTATGLRRFDAATKALVPEPAFGVRFADGSTSPLALTEDADGALWIAPQHAGDTQTWSETTLGRVTRAGAWEPLAVPDLTRIGDINGLRLEREGGREILWVVGVSGILRVDVAALRSPGPVGATLVREALAAENRSLLDRAAAPPTALAYAQNSVRFRVAAPGLAAQSGVQFETELLGLTRDAHHLSRTAEREFTNLGEGNYVFRARARSANGRWTAPAEFAFIVLPPWWRTPWAYALWAALAAGGVVGFVRLRTRALHRRAGALEAIVADRTQELHARNQELTRLHKLELDEKISARLAEEKARLEVLRYQLNPHFLFNALNSICTQIMQQPAAARAMVVRLADFCRHTLHRPHAEESLTVGEELQLLRAYLDIEKARLGELLVLEIAADPGVEAVRIPPFLLLPLVENAVKYGAATSRDCLRVRIAIRRPTDDSLVLEISNSGEWVTAPVAGVNSTKIGLENIRQRLARHYPAAHQLTTEARDGWVVVRLKISNRQSPIEDPEPTSGKNRQSAIGHRQS